MIKQIGADKTKRRNYFSESIEYQKKASIENVLDARHLNSKTYQSSEFWPPLARQLAWAKEKHKSAFDFLYAYEHATLDDETTKLSELSSGDKLSLH